jgi:signal transduction histidine kinase
MTSTAPNPASPQPERRIGWWMTVSKYALGLAPFVIVWVVLVGWLAYLISTKAKSSDEADEATIREWLAETRPFRKTLPELIRDYATLRQQRDDDRSGSQTVANKRSELEEQLRALTEPIRVYDSKLPGFPIVYRLSVEFGEPVPETIVWESQLPRLRKQTQVKTLRLQVLGTDETHGEVVCEYQMHALNNQQRNIENQRQVNLLAQTVLVAATLVAGVFVYRFLRRELWRENERLAAAAAAEHQQRELLETELRRQEAERAKEELDRKLLEQQLAAATLEKRADEAEKTTLEMKSQLYASIGIMAGSYAHNIKNLLVRPNDLLNRCIESDGLSATQQMMLSEVKGTLGTVTERLQQILKTVRRDTGVPEMTRIDLAKLAADTAHNWTDMARDKWKLVVVLEASDETLMVKGDLSHLQQAIENLVFNARDATFEMRNHLREEARKAPPDVRKQKLIDAAGWRGMVTIAARREGTHAVFEVRDNGIGMTEAVRQNCLATHFSTKRDNAIYEGYTAGMGLGLSFVAMVLERHQATLNIESAPLHGAMFRIRFPLADE